MTTNGTVVLIVIGEPSAAVVMTSATVEEITATTASPAIELVVNVEADCVTTEATEVVILCPLKVITVCTDDVNVVGARVATEVTTDDGPVADCKVMMF